jgi:hypothetical protein
MKQRYQQLATRFQEEIEELERVVNRITYVWPQAERATTDQDIYVESVALNPHGFYLGLERLFELTAKHIDQNLPGGERWHHDLLLFISRPTNTVRIESVDIRQLNNRCVIW